MFIGYTIGSALGGVIAAQLIPDLGLAQRFCRGRGAAHRDRACFTVGPPGMGPVLMVKRGRTDIRCSVCCAVSAPIPPFPITPRFWNRRGEQGRLGSHLFADGRASMTALLWLAYAANIVSAASLFDELAADRCRRKRRAARSCGDCDSSLARRRRVGSLVVGRSSSRIGTLGIVAAFMVAVPCVAALGHVGTNETPLWRSVIVTGLCVIGGQVADQRVGRHALSSLYALDRHRLGLGVGASDRSLGR